MTYSKQMSSMSGLHFLLLVQSSMWHSGNLGNLGSNEEIQPEIPRTGHWNILMIPVGTFDLSEYAAIALWEELCEDTCDSSNTSRKIACDKSTSIQRRSYLMLWWICTKEYHQENTPDKVPQLFGNMESIWLEFNLQWISCIFDQKCCLCFGKKNMYLVTLE